jgi:hypothetical protein
MSRPVSRGVFGVERAGAARLKPMDAAEVSAHAYIVIAGLADDTYQLKDRRALMRRLLRGEPDIHGRRLYTPESRDAAHYVIRIINLRLRGAALSKLQDERLKSSLLTVFKALEAGMP